MGSSSFWVFHIFLFLHLLASISEAQLNESKPVGISTIHCTEPAARASCDSILDTVYTSGVSRPALTFLVDGSFGSDFDYMMNMISLLTEGGRELHLMLYLSNGPRQRTCRSQIGKPGYAVSVCRTQFNNIIKSDENLQEGFVEIAKSVLPVVEFAESRGAKVYINLSLEDNWTTETFEFMLGLVKDLFPPSVKFVRNRNLHSKDPITPGILIEKHHASHKQLSYTGGFSINDGVSTKLFNVKNSYERRTSFSSTKRLRNRAWELGNVFLLWNAQLQGLKRGRKIATPNRKYLVLSDRNKSELRLFLRGH